MLVALGNGAVPLALNGTHMALALTRFMGGQVFPAVRRRLTRASVGTVGAASDDLGA